MSDRHGESGRESGSSGEPRDTEGLPPTLEPEAYYDEYGHEEWERLEATLGGHLEFEGTTDYLERYLPASGAGGTETDEPTRVLDAGGGAGRYSVWLAERGYAVTLVDVSETQCAIAREKARDHGVSELVTVERGDLRSLPLERDSVDAVLCTGGPLSHLPEASDRERALAELRRVARAGAPVFVSVMSRLAVLQNLVTDPDYAPALEPIASDGTYDAQLAREELPHLEPDFTACHFFRAAELEAALEAAGFDVAAMVGLEGVATNVGERIDLADLEDDVVAAVTEAVRDLRTDPAVVDWSNHLLAVARVPG